MKTKKIIDQKRIYIYIYILYKHGNTLLTATCPHFMTLTLKTEADSSSACRQSSASCDMTFRNTCITTGIIFICR